MKAAVLLALSLAVYFFTAGARNVEEEIATHYPQVPPDQRQYFANLLKLSFTRWNNTQTTINVQDFDCPTYPPQEPPPTSVNRLRPADISFVGAMGDSLTAAFGAKATSLLDLFNDWRGVSFSIGGDEDADRVLTVANILKKYNPRIHGFSTGVGNADSAGARLNVAITGATVQGLNEQIDRLVRRLKESPDFEHSWKMVSILIGANNLCAYCRDREANSPNTFGKTLEKALDRLKAEVPRLLVNIMTVIDVTILHEVNTGFCGLLHELECSCGVSRDEEVRREVSQASREYNVRIRELSMFEKFNNEEFAVVVQPWFQDTPVPRLSDGSPDTSYFAPDCFHFSAKGHHSAAVGLWNNLNERVNHKKTSWVPGEPITCPTEDQFIYTRRNTPDL